VICERAPGAVVAAAALTIMVSISPAEARIVGLEILRTEPVANSQDFGAAGPYERVFARARGEVDPADPKNAIIQDLNLAPRNARGAVEYTTEVEILKPKDIARGNRVLFFEAPNRGNKLAFANFNEGVTGPAADRNNLASLGDGHLMREGYTLVWVGWEMDVRPGSNRVGMAPIVVKNPNGSPITGIVRSEIIIPAASKTAFIGASQQVLQYPAGSYDIYPAATTDNRAAGSDGFVPTLTVRARRQDPRIPIPPEAWSFGACPEGGTASPDDKSLCMDAGFLPGRLYELIYRAKDPTVLGLGFAATRDVGHFLRTAERDEAGALNPLYRPGQVATIFGSSQSGRMLRSMLQLGFNQSETGERVFAGMYPHIGGGLMPLNVRFGQPVRAWGEQSDNLYPAYDFPFTYGRQFDPLTERSQGLLDRCAATGTCPNIFHVATTLEMWEGRQSLGFTDPLGRRDFTDPPEVRTFIMASTQHGAAALPLVTKAPFGNCQQQPNPNPQLWTMRALLASFTGWVRDGVSPPPTTVPRIADGTLVAPDDVRLPSVPANGYGGVDRPALSTARVYNPLHVLDFGPLYRPEDTSGIITLEPPRVSTAAYGVLEPQVDADGNDLGGIRSVFAQVPIGTYTGWNLGRKERFENGMCNLQGSFVPFATTKAERLATGDPRQSLEERYPDAETYKRAFKAAAGSLVSQRFLRPEDSALLVSRNEALGTVRAGP
jgi:hypothetical protein